MRFEAAWINNGLGFSPDEHSN